jgi:hypothetical protein
MKKLTKQISNLTLHNSPLDPRFVSGFTDGEGSFIIGLSPSNKYKIGYQTQLIFKITLHNKDIELLSKIQSYFGVGNITGRACVVRPLSNIM